MKLAELNAYPVPHHVWISDQNLQMTGGQRVDIEICIRTCPVGQSYRS